LEMEVGDQEANWFRTLLLPTVRTLAAVECVPCLRNRSISSKRSNIKKGVCVNHRTAVSVVPERNMVFNAVWST
jgi:flagellar biosynthesis protein FliR